MMNFTIPNGLTNPVIKLSLKLESIPKTFAISSTFPLGKTSYLDCGEMRKKEIFFLMSDSHNAGPVTRW